MKKTEVVVPAMDDTDFQILSLLKDNARISMKAIAEKTFLSSTAVAARVEKLERDGYITGYYTAFSADKFGLGIKAFINLELEPIQKSEFYPYIRACKNVVECNCVTGEYSMLLTVVFPSTSALDLFIGELQHFGKTKTQIVFSTPVPHREVLTKV